RYHDVVVLDLQPVIEPGLLPPNRARKCEAWDKLVECQAILVLNRRNEVGCIESESVVSHAGAKCDDPAGCSAIFRWISRLLDLYRTNRIGTDPHCQQSANRRGDVESIQEIECLVGTRSRDVHLLGCILYDTRIER